MKVKSVVDGEGDLWGLMRPGEDFLSFLKRLDDEKAENRSKLENTLAFKHQKLRSSKNRIINDYQRGKSWNYISKHYGLSESTIRKALKSWKVPNRGFVRYETKVVLDNKDDIIRLYKEGWSSTRIAEKYGLADPTIQLRLKEWGVKPHPRRKYDPDKAVELLKKGLDPQEVADKLGVGDSAIYKLRAKELGRVSNKKAYIGSITEKLVNTMYRRGFSIEEIFRQLKKRGLFRRVETALALRNFIEKQSPSGMRGYKRLDYMITPGEAGKYIGLLQQGVSIEDASYKTMIPLHKLNEYMDNFKLIKYASWREVPDQKAALNKIKELRRKGYTVTMISFFTGIPNGIIVRLLHEETNIRLKKTRIDGRVLAPKIREMRLKKMTVPVIAKRLGVSVAVVGRIIREYKIPYVKKVFDDVMVRKIKDLYKANVHPKDIAKRLGVKEKSLQLEIQRQGIMRTDKPWNIKHTAYSKEEVEHQNFIIRKYYTEPYFKSIHEISQALSLDKTTVRNRLKEMGIKVRGPDEARKLRKVHKYHRIKIHPETQFIVHRRKYKLMSQPVKKMIQEYKGGING